jgi:hypothetical protein
MNNYSYLGKQWSSDIAYNLCTISLMITTALERINKGMQSCSWLRHYATRRKVAGLIPDEVIGFFN